MANTDMPTLSGGSGGTGKTISNWAAAAKATFNVSDLPLPGNPGTLTGEQLLQEFEYLAQTNAGVWGSIRDVLQRTNPNSYTAKDMRSHLNWIDGADIPAIRNTLTRLHNINQVAQTSSQPVLTVGSYLIQSKQYAKTHGVTPPGVSAAAAPALVPVPAAADLEKVAQSAFATTLGRSASPQEVAAFAKAYQSATLSYGDAKNDAKKQSMFAPPTQPIQFQQSGQIPSPTPSSAPVDSTAIQQPPPPDVAASNFAAQTNPVQASAQAAADGLGQFLTMLKGS